MFSGSKRSAAASPSGGSVGGGGGGGMSSGNAPILGSGNGPMTTRCRRVFCGKRWGYSTKSDPAAPPPPRHFSEPKRGPRASKKQTNLDWPQRHRDTEVAQRKPTCFAMILAFSVHTRCLCASVANATNALPLYDL